MIHFVIKGIRNHKWLVLLFLVLMLSILVGDLLFFPDTLEDAYITFRYSKHLADGFGLGAWNKTGERVEGYSSFLWMIILSPYKMLAVEVETFAKLLGIISHLAIVFTFLLVYFRSRLKYPDPASESNHLDRDVFLLSAILFAYFLPINWYATTGMETVSFIFLTTLAFLLPFISNNLLLISITTVAVVLMRPEGIFFAASISGYHGLIQLRGHKSLGLPIFSFFIAILCYSGLTVYRYLVFDEFLPNTYYAKVAGGGIHHLNLGFTYVKDWISANIPLFILFVIGLIFAVRQAFVKARRTNLGSIYLVLIALFYVVYIIQSGGDNFYAFPFWRHILHLMPILSILFSETIVRLFPGKRFFRFTLLVAILFVGAVSNLNQRDALMIADIQETLSMFPFIVNEPYDPYYLWIDAITDENTVIAGARAGEMPFVVDAVHIDMLGLNDEIIARTGKFDPTGPVDSKTNISYVFNRQPDIIMGYFNAKPILRNRSKKEALLGRFQMTFEILDNPVFQNEYLFLVNGPYESIDRPLFLRRDFWENHSLKMQLDCIPVLETVLFKEE